MQWMKPFRRSTAIIGFVLTSAGCAPDHAPAQPPVVLTAQTAAQPERTQEPPKPEAAPAATSSGRAFVVQSLSRPEDIDGPGSAPCDFERSYRGVVGKSKVTLVVHATDGKLTGLSHYDREGSSLVLSGSRSGSDFVLTENPGGSFKGSCDSNGVLRGQFSFGKRQETFELQPRPKDWPGIYKVTRRITVEPNHPICKLRALQNEAIETSPDGEDYPRIVCLPRNPTRRRELLADAPHLMCHAQDVGYRVFGLASSDAERRVNAALAGTEYESGVKAIQTCTGTRSSYTGMSLVDVRGDFISVMGFSSQDFGGAHPINGGTGGTLIDLGRGTSVSLSEIVDVAKLRDVAAACLPIYRLSASAEPSFELLGDVEPTDCEDDGATMGRFLWACEKDDRAEPFWAVVAEGIVIGSWANPHVSAALDGRGPILPWEVLLREGVLKLDSPVKFLWRGVSPAPASTLPCSSSYEGNELRRWRPVPSRTESP